MTERVRAEGRFLRAGHDVCRVRGVTYGSFQSRLDGWRFPDTAQIKADLAAMARTGVNTIRLYELPPPELVELAGEYGLRLLVGLDYHDWRSEQSHGRAARRRVRDAGRRAVDEAMNVLVGDPCVLAIGVGNEIPSDLVRFHGAGEVADILSELIAAVHEADPNMLATYVNYPTTEFLEPDGQDLVAFNVFLEEVDQLRRYVRHLQVISGPRPLLLTELGLAARVHGEKAQAESLRWQLRSVDELGCAGATVFAWTDEWAVADEPVPGWDFGLTTADRQPKLALDVFAAWATSAPPADLRGEWPRVSVVVCTHNEERNIETCLDSLLASTYPDLDVIVCDDGSTDATVELARQYPFRVMPLPFVGLSGARNAGLAAATGEIIAYLDADAACHPEWPFHLALSLEEDVAATGGPNLPFPDAGLVERAVALSPGNPSEVLVADDRAEHVPGCSMAFKRETLLAIGGFDTIFTTAGDDVDVCWKLLDAGHEIGFGAAAQVFHHRRSSIRGYLKQQRGYGRAERLLSDRHPDRFNGFGQTRWTGVIYGGVRLLARWLRPIVYSGSMGTASYQPVVGRPSELLIPWIGAVMPVVVLLLVAASLAALSSPGLLWAAASGAAGVVVYAMVTGASARVGHQETKPVRVRALVGWLHLLQPLARFWGRITGPRASSEPPAHQEPWTGDRLAWLRSLQTSLRRRGCHVKAGSGTADWDLEVSLGPILSARLRTAVAWHWEPRHRLTYRLRPAGWFLLLALAIAGVSGADRLWYAVGLLLVGVMASAVLLRRRTLSALDETTEGAS